jgi:serine/threonine protein kinase
MKGDVQVKDKPKLTGLNAAPEKKALLNDVFGDDPINGRYEVELPIDQGGLGLVYKALDLSLKRSVAIKIFVGDFETEDGMDKAYDLALRESQIAASLNHPNIVAIYEYGVLVASPERNPFIVMEYIPGKSLLDLSKERSLSVHELTSIFIQICKALTFAHTQPTPVLHRDVKPRNILVRDDGRVVLIDFGFSRLMDGAKTTMNVFGFSSSYMAPELLQAYFSNSPEDVLRANHPKADLYSLGASMYRLFTGKNPIPGEQAIEIINALRTHEIVKPSTKNIDIPERLDKIILSLLELDPEKRTATAAEVEQGLREVLKLLKSDDEMKEDTIPKNEGSANGPIKDILDDSHFNDVSELREYRKQREESAIHKIEKNLKGPEVDRFLEFVKHQEKASKKHIVQTVAIVLTSLVFAYFVMRPGTFSGKPAKAPKQDKANISLGGEGAAKLPLMNSGSDDKAMGMLLPPNTRENLKTENAPTKGTQRATNVSSRGTARSGQARRMGDKLVMWKEDAGEVSTSATGAMGVPGGTVIRDVFLMHKVVSHNMGSPVRAQLRKPFDLPSKGTILPRETVFIGEAVVLPTKDRVHIVFVKAILPDQTEIKLDGTALMEDGSSGLVGQVEWDKGRTPVVESGKNLLSLTSQAAVAGIEADSYSGKVGKTMLGGAVKNGSNVVKGDDRPLPIITIEPYTPMQIFLNKGF